MVLAPPPPGGGPSAELVAQQLIAALAKGAGEVRATVGFLVGSQHDPAFALGLIDHLEQNDPKSPWPRTLLIAGALAGTVELSIFDTLFATGTHQPGWNPQWTVSCLLGTHDLASPLPDLLAFGNFDDRFLEAIGRMVVFGTGLDQQPANPSVKGAAVRALARNHAFALPWLSAPFGVAGTESRLVRILASNAFPAADPRYARDIADAIRSLGPAILPSLAGPYWPDQGLAFPESVRDAIAQLMCDDIAKLASAPLSEKGHLSWQARLFTIVAFDSNGNRDEKRFKQLIDAAAARALGSLKKWNQKLNALPAYEENVYSTAEEYGTLFAFVALPVLRTIYGAGPGGATVAADWIARGVDFVVGKVLEARLGEAGGVIDTFVVSPAIDWMKGLITGPMEEAQKEAKDAGARSLVEATYRGAAGSFLRMLSANSLTWIPTEYRNGAGHKKYLSLIIDSRNIRALIESGLANASPVEALEAIAVYEAIRDMMSHIDQAFMSWSPDLD